MIIKKFGLPSREEDVAAFLFFRLCLARFLSYFALGLVSVCMPILVFKITGSASLAGISMLIELAPKILSYMFGGALAAYKGERRVCIGAEISRVFGVSLIMAGFFLSEWLLLAFGASFVQIGGALLNVVGDASVSRLCPPLTRANAHASIMKISLSASLLSALSAAVLPEVVSLFMAMSLFFFGLFVLRPVLTETFSRSKTTEEYRPSSVFQGVFAVFSFLRKEPRLLFGTLLACSFSMPLAIASAQLPFFASALSSISIGTSDIALFASLRNILSVFSLSAAKPFFLSNRLFSISSVALCGALVATVLFLFAPQIFPHLAIFGSAHVIALILLAVPLSLLSAFHTLWSGVWRHQRQTLLPDGMHVSAIGVLISFEVVSFVLGALLFSFFGKTPFFLFGAISFFFILFVFLYFVKFGRELRETPSF